MPKEVKSRQAGRRVGTALFQTHLIRRKSHFPQVQVDFCAGQNVGVGLVVIERNAELGAYIVQTVAAQAEPPARFEYRAQKRDIRRSDIRRAAAASQHPAVEAGVMGDKVVRTAHERGKIRPEFHKAGAVPEHVPGKTVDFRNADPGRGLLEDDAQFLKHILEGEDT